MPRRQDHTRIVCRTAERTRIKVSSKRKTESELEKIARKLEQAPGIRKVATNLRTGSILVDHEVGVGGEVVATLKDLGIILMTMEGESEPQRLTSAVADLDRRLGLDAEGRISLRLLVPLGLGAFATIQLLRRGLEFTAAPWYVLAFAAFESYVRLNPADQKPLESCMEDE